MVKCLSTMRETWVGSLGGEDLLEKEMAIHSSILPGKSHRWSNLIGYSPWGHKESDMTELLSTPSIKYEQNNHFRVENINAALSFPPQSS